MGKQINDSDREPENVTQQKPAKLPEKQKNDDHSETVLGQINNSDRKPENATQQKPAKLPEKQKNDDHSETVLGQVKEAVTESVQILSDKAMEVTQEAREKINAQVGSGREVIRTTLEDTAQALNDIGDSDSPLIMSLKPYTSRVGTLLDDTSNYLNTVTPQHLIQDARTLARNNPGIFVGGALALGLVTARFLKSASDADKDF